MLNESMEMVKSLVDSAKIVNSNSKSQSKLIKIVILSSLGICLLAGLAAVSFAGGNHNKSSRLYASSGVQSGSNRNKNPNLLQQSQSPSGDGNGRPLIVDLTILGSLSDGNNGALKGRPGQNILKATPEEGEDAGTSTDSKDEEEPIVRISRQGRIRGTVLKSRKNRNYYAFYQVPYARPPVGKRRFALPERPRRWRGIRDGTKKGVACMQKEKYASSPNETGGSEDCLHLNIYTPKLPERRRDSQKLPVLFYIHGGGVHGNGTRYGANYFMDEDCILITINYRLGMFGGFTTGTREFPGNTASRDQVMALEWVQRNIHRFGGDPKRVLIFGNSSGGGFVHAHIFSPMSQGLFHCAILQSGSAIEKSTHLTEPLDVVRDFTIEVGCGDFNRSFEETMDCLRDLPAETVALSAGQADMFGFVEETQYDDLKNKFLPGFPMTLIDEGRVASKVPVILGVNSRENMFSLDFILNENTIQDLNDNLEAILPGLVEIPDDAQHSVGKRFREVYFDGQEVSNETRFQVWDLLSDSTNHATRVSGMAHANVTEMPVYFYWLSKQPQRSYAQATKEIYPPPYGVSHADELQYLFVYVGYPEYPVGSPWYEFSKNLVKTWVSFARDGKPDVRRPGVSVDWEPMSLADNGMKWLQLDDEIKYVEPFTKRMELWDDYIDVLYE